MVPQSKTKQPANVLIPTAEKKRK